MKTYVLAGGCFWCLDAVFRRLRGVHAVTSGYTGGKDATQAQYTLVATGTTGHAEVVQVMFDETVIPSAVVLDMFFLIHDPTTKDRQGNDHGSQYRSAMFYADMEQKREFEYACARAASRWDDPIVTELVALDGFYEAEAEHQDYFRRHPESGYCQVVIAPKVTKARRSCARWFVD